MLLYSRMFITLFVSAFWHGVAPGYYLTFMCVPLVVIAEMRMQNAIKPYLSPKLCYWYDWLSWFFHYRSMEYLGCGFMLLQLAPCWAAWKSMYFIGHIVLFAFILIPSFIPKKHSNDKEARKKLSWFYMTAVTIKGKKGKIVIFTINFVYILLTRQIIVNKGWK